uniref:Uncharacterized protein n=1 Tax=Sphenodon punctatus TaxID=8508 RepID=A0A8D0L443_SPHPU
HVPSGLICHPDREHLIYPLGCTVIIQGLSSHSQDFLHGHTNNVSCVTISPSGCYVASGQVTFMGFKIFCGTTRRGSCCLACRFTRVKSKTWPSLQTTSTWCHW